MPEAIPKPRFSEFVSNWLLDPQVVFLNHGSYGACPLRVIERQRHFQEQMEREPLRFMTRELDGLVEKARASLAAFLGADPAGLVFVQNATEGVNAVLRSLKFEPGDELLTNNHEYNACNNALRWVAEHCSGGVNVVSAEAPFPLQHPKQVTQAILARVTPRTRLAMISHVTSPTGLVFPVAEIVAKLRERGVDTLVDGAHAPGMIPLDLRSIGATWYVGNCHKWMCAPKGAGFLYVHQEERREELVPAVISHGMNAKLGERSRFHEMFDWTGTNDFSAWLCLPETIAAMEQMIPGGGGWPAVMASNRAKVLEARKTLCRMLGVEPPAPESMIGSLATIPLSDAPQPEGEPDPQLGRLYDDHAIQVPQITWPRHPKRWVRISAQLYNHPSQYEYLGEVLKRLTRG